MLIGVASDTHGQLAHTRRAVRMLESLGPDVVLHCGDIGDPAIAPLFQPWPTHFVFGNVDHDEEELCAAIATTGLTCHGRFGELTLLERRIAFLHGDDTRRLEQTIDGGQYDLVCYGHTHRAAQRRQGRTLVLNPGAVYRANPHSIAVVDLRSMQATVVSL